MSRPTHVEARMRRQEKIRRYNDDLLVCSRRLIAASLTLLKQGKPSTYLGTKRQAPEPNSVATQHGDRRGADRAYFISRK
jgi:hypothetical protein